MFKFLCIAGSINAFVAVALGAFGAHGLKQRLSVEMMAVFQTGVQYHFYHALGLFAVALVAARHPQSALIQWSAWLMLGGIVLFSGSLYGLSLSNIRGLGAITPIGGLALLASWLCLAGAAANA